MNLPAGIFFTNCRTPYPQHGEYYLQGAFSMTLSLISPNLSCKLGDWPVFYILSKASQHETLQNFIFFGIILTFFIYLKKNIVCAFIDHYH